MATGTLLSVEEYLATTWRPDRDYLEGELVERNMGQLSHGRLQILIGAWMLRGEARWRIKAVMEVRLQNQLPAFSYSRRNGPFERSSAGGNRQNSAVAVH